MMHLKRLWTSLTKPDVDHFWVTSSYEVDADMVARAKLIELGPHVIHIDNDVLRYGGYIPGQHGYRPVFTEDRYDADRYVRPLPLWACHVVGHWPWRMYHRAIGKSRKAAGMPSRWQR